MVHFECAVNSKSYYTISSIFCKNSERQSPPNAGKLLGFQ